VGKKERLSWISPTVTGGDIVDPPLTAWRVFEKTFEPLDVFWKKWRPPFAPYSERVAEIERLHTAV